jgi:hypothetical protein
MCLPRAIGITSELTVTPKFTKAKNNRMTRIKLMLALWAFSIVTALAYTPQDTTRTEEKKPTVFQFFAAIPEVPKVVLKADFSEMIDNKLKLDRYEAQLEIFGGEDNQSWDIELSMRGKSRRRICDLPPLRVHFPRKLLKKNDIRRKHNTLKLVSYCKDKANFEYYILREYMAYLMYNQLTDYSFKVKLVQIDYEDINGGFSPVSRYGFLIENTDELAERLNAKEKAKYQMGRDSLNQYQYDVLALFQYLISNTDWRIGALHNIKVIKDKDTDEYYAIPYDFDYSGFVNTEYSIPNPDFNQASIYTRIYLGDCREFEALQDARKRVLKMKNELLTCPDNWPFKSKQCKRSLKFIKRSYKILEKDKSYRRNCLKKAY